jgi:Protein of unknown function (DUF3093)
MSDYHERLRPPLSWWFIAAVSILVLGTELVSGFSVLLSVVIYGGMAVICAAFLLHWGGAVVSVRGDVLRAGKVRLPLAYAGEVRPLDATQTRAMRGPRADPTAYMLIRPYLKQSVYVEVTGPNPDWPYLLICTRHPGSLAEAIEKTRARLMA